jgi:integrase
VPNSPTAYIFARERRGTPLHLDNLSRRVIQPAMNGGWKGWHAFRRGLATWMRESKVQLETIQEILRHSDPKVTRDSYVVVRSQKTRKALDRLSDAGLLKAWRTNPKRMQGWHRQLFSEIFGGYLGCLAQNGRKMDENKMPDITNRQS